MSYRLAGRTVALAITGSIAAYKAIEVARRLVTSGARVIPVMTESAAKFIGPVTLSGICGEPVATSMWDPAYPGEMHVAIADAADVIAIVPATADTMARLTHGRADDLVMALALCARAPIVIAPAMHPRMWSNAATQANVATLSARGYKFAGPVDGPVASGDSGVGRMADPDAIVDAIVEAMTPQDLRGVRMLVTAGPTIEDVDPVRFIGNRSSGKMGFAIARNAAMRGAEVTLVAGPVALATPRGVTRIDVRSAQEMHRAVIDAVGEAMSNVDAVVMAAAVADYRPREMSEKKLKKQGDHTSVEVVRNVDILAELGAMRANGAPLLVGFAVETGDRDAIVGYARGKILSKRVDVVIANEAAVAFGGDENAVYVVEETSVTDIPRAHKDAVAGAVVDWVMARLKNESL